MAALVYLLRGASYDVLFTLVSGECGAGRKCEEAKRKGSRPTNFQKQPLLAPFLRRRNSTSALREVYWRCSIPLRGSARRYARTALVPSVVSTLTPFLSARSYSGTQSRVMHYGQIDPDSDEALLWLRNTATRAGATKAFAPCCITSPSPPLILHIRTNTPCSFTLAPPTMIHNRPWRKV